MIPMPPFTRSAVLVAGFAAAGFVAAACGVTALQADSRKPSENQVLSASGAEPVRCEIRIDEARGATTIEGHVSAERPVQGSYRLAITSRSSGGRATISQSGEFEAGPRAPVMLGQTTLRGPRASHQAELDLRIEGRRLSCAEASARAGTAAPSTGAQEL